jgi:hypothetical protein
VGAFLSLGGVLLMMLGYSPPALSTEAGPQ